MDFHGLLGKLRAIESLAVREAEECNMTAEGEMCPVHGMEECSGYGDDKGGMVVTMPLTSGVLDEGPVYAAMSEGGPDRDGEYFSDEDSLAGSTIGQGGTSGTIPHISEGAGNLEDILDSHEAAVRNFIINDELDDELFHALFDYYSDEMPYGVKKARDGDPMEWIADRLGEELRSMGLYAHVKEEAPLGGVPFTPLGATNNGPDQQGFVVTGGTDVNYFEEGKQMSLKESMTINSSVDIRDGKITKTLNVSATDDEVESLASLLRLAGMGGRMQIVAMPASHEEKSCGCQGPCDCEQEKPCGCQGPCDCEEPTMENADHDYGHDAKSEAGEPLDVQDYIWDGPHINQRFGKIGDNTLMSERRETLYKSLSEQYEQFLAEAELAPSDVGSQSPLTATDRDEFDKDPFAGDKAVTDGSHSPLSTIKRQDVMN